ncbi:2-amino-4-hydroxy-6-hydroxymethyldihydropteridine diphosphokinase [Fusobacterium sp. FSA-380-WT-3A]|uniref:2-amino-4-hydroxy-6- hydroxymethyldihydropteridine diphosphokinase n=1 Tax=Fusobacterium sp. FSA-380-WT-3A TaxID=2725304 RepID=UPI001476F4C0|nr:2-amino-4-hydroxy-6-hydroxymethyldihydropteridine diphosphokinase [Fusobacterium sp. FSA-380-WT-3A]NME36511.1 2-amino-4-hydroxy-6-hydroxymethyldihydropteridine diphosphokinase [Fusobacterium sp. FSA-380-WT-3A]
MDKIIIENLELIGNHGVFKEEKVLGQKFLISVEMITNTRKAGKTGDLDASTHYGFVADDIEKLFLNESFDLIETCAEKMAQMILTKYKLINEVKVTIKKPWAPLKKHFDFVAVEITRKWHTAYLSLGSNMGDKKGNLLNAIENIKKLEDTKVTKVSTILETEPYGYTQQDMFLNACIEIKTLLTASELIEKLLEIELLMGRKRIIKWGPRIIDLDILLFDNDVINTENLIIPHPYMCDRMFVLEPLFEIAPYVIHPVKRASILELKNSLEEKQKKY